MKLKKIKIELLNGEIGKKKHLYSIKKRLEKNKLSQSKSTCQTCDPSHEIRITSQKTNFFKKYEIHLKNNKKNKYDQPVEFVTQVENQDNPIECK